jgi:hypothetical protein
MFITILDTHMNIEEVLQSQINAPTVRAEFISTRTTHEAWEGEWSNVQSSALERAIENHARN